MSYTLYNEIRVHEREMEKIRARAQRRAQRLGKPFDLTARERRQLNLSEIKIEAVKRILAKEF